jgi:S-DNA-T family DNA segregation ATPase FtsK/SpoIIIE
MDFQQKKSVSMLYHCRLYFVLTWDHYIKKKHQGKLLAGLLIFATNTTIALSAIPNLTDPTTQDLMTNGGMYGHSIHTYLQALLSRPIEIITISVAYLIALILITNKNPEDIIDNISKKQEDLHIHIGLPQKNEKKEKKPESTADHNNTEDTPTITSVKSKENTTANTQNNNVSNKPDADITVIAKNTDSKSTNEVGPKFLDWTKPPASLLKEPIVNKVDEQIYRRTSQTIQQTLANFNVKVHVKSIHIGPTVVRYALEYDTKTRVSKIQNLSSDLALALATPETQIRIEIPIPGTSYIGIEMPNPVPNYVFIKEGIEELNRSDQRYELPLILGRNVAGKFIIEDLTNLPHLLVAGATGSGKSAGINSMIMGLLMSKSPDEVRFMFVDPKSVELGMYNSLPYLLSPVITDMSLAANAFKWAVGEMERRYRLLSSARVKNIKEYNDMHNQIVMPYIVIIIDEMADLILTKKTDVEEHIIRIAQKARAVGIHLILATQKPSVNVITGLIKSNIPGRISFSVATATDSRVIIDQRGAEKLIGNGDMLFKSPKMPKPVRIQAAYTDLSDINNVTDFIKEETLKAEVEVDDEIESFEQKMISSTQEKHTDLQSNPELVQAINIVIESGKASTSYLQRRMSIGYTKAARFMDTMEEMGVVGPQNNSKPRDVLINSIDELQTADE